MTLRPLLLRILLLVPIALLTNSCEFETDRVYERDAQENVKPPEISVADLDLDNDTIYLFYGRNIPFRFVSNNQPVESVRIIIDGAETQAFTSGEGVFLLDHYRLDEGQHTLQLELITSSGSNSMADILGAEGFIFTKTWVLFVVKDFSGRHETRVKNGCLNFSWKVYPSGDFREYVIYREKSYSERVEVGRTTSAEFTDCSYAGEGGTYYVEVLKKDGTFFDWGWGYAEPGRELPELSFSCTKDNVWTVKWTKSKYTNAISATYLSIARGNSTDFVRVMESISPEDTAWTVPSGYFFAERVAFRLQVVPVNNVIYNSGFYERFESTLYDLALGFKYKPLNENGYHLTQVSADEFIYILGCDSLVRYSLSGLRPVDRLSYNPSYCSMCKFVDFRVSASGKFLTTFVDCDNDLMIAETGTLKNNSRYDLHSISVPTVFTLVPVSDAGTGIIPHPQSGFYVYDFSSSSVLGYYSNDNYQTSGTLISANGKYIFLKDNALRLVNFDGSGFKGVWSQPAGSTVRYYGFHGTDDEKLVIWDGSLISVRNCSDFSEAWSFPFSDANLLSIDYFNNEFLSYTPGYLHVRSLLDGSPVKDIPVNIDPTNWYYSCILTGHAVINSTGVIYFY